MKKTLIFFILVVLSLFLVSCTEPTATDNGVEERMTGAIYMQGWNNNTGQGTIGPTDGSFIIYNTTARTFTINSTLIMNGANITTNATCMTLHSPDGSGVLNICNT